MTEGIRRFSEVSDVWAVFAGALTGNWARTVVAVLAVALGVALGFAVQLINQAAVNELTQGVRTLAGDADLTVRGPRSGFAEDLYPRLAQDPDVAIASPMIEVEVRVTDRGESLRVLGLDPFRAGWMQPGLIGEARDRLDTLRPDTIFLSVAAQRALAVEVGDTIVLQAGLRGVAFRVAGQLAGVGIQRLGVMDVAGAQEAFDRMGRLTRIDLRLRPGVDGDRFAARWRTLLPAGVVVERPEASLRATASVSRSYRVNLNVLALVALFTGGLLVFTTQALSVVRRRTQFALLRVLGVTRRRLVSLVLLEGALLGMVGAVLGLAIGYLFASLALRYAGADLGAGYFRGVGPSVPIDIGAMLIFFGLGVAAAVSGSVVPAREAGAAKPARALRAGDEETALTRLRPPRRGVLLMVAGAALVVVPPVGGLPLAGYAAIACLLIGTLLILPSLAVMVLTRLPPPRRAAPALALAQLRGAPGQVAVSLAAIVASVSLMVSMAIMVNSFRQSLDDWLLRVLPAEVYLRAAPASDVAFLSPEDQSRIARVAGVRRAEFSREEQVLLDPSRPRVVVLARAIGPNVAGILPFVDTPLAVAPDAPPPVWVNEAMVDRYVFAPGKVVTLPLAGVAQPFTVAGVWRDYGRPQGAVVIDRERYLALTGDRTATNGALWLEPGADAAQVRQAIRDAVVGGERLEIGSPGEIREASLKAFDRTFAVTYALEFAAVAIGLVGLSSAFGALVLARRREFGVLRHLGMTRRQIVAMLATEGATTATLGVAVGLALGFVISLILIHVVNRQSFHWGMELAIPWGNLALFGSSVILLASMTAAASGRRATSVDALRAVREDW